MVRDRLVTRKQIGAALLAASALGAACGVNSTTSSGPPRRDGGAPPEAGSDGAVAPSDGGPGGPADDSGMDAAAPGDPSHVPLASGWLIQSSAVATDPGTVISTAAYTPSQWYPTTVPSTVLASLVANNVYQDILTGMNFRSVPGTTYPIGSDFLSIEDDIPMPADSPFLPPWWFRTQFQAPDTAATTLHFDGINYRADIFLNGQQIAANADVNGTYRRYDFDITPYLVPGQNTLAVAVTAQQPTELGLDFVDWNPAPADKLMGIIRDAYLVKHGGVEIRDPYVATHLAGNDRRAHRRRGAPQRDDRARSPGRSAARSTRSRFSQDVTIAAGADDRGDLRSDDVPQLTLANPASLVAGQARGARPVLARSPVHRPAGTSSTSSRPPSASARSPRRSRTAGASSRSTESRSSSAAPATRPTSSTGKTRRGRRPSCVRRSI